MEAHGGRGLPRILSPQITALVPWTLFFPGLEHTEFNEHCDSTPQHQNLWELKKKTTTLIWGSRKILFHGYWKFLDFSWTWFKFIWICTQNSTSHLMALEPLRSILLFYDSNNPKACLLSITWCQLLRWAQVHLIHALATGCHELLESHSCYH